MYIYKQPEFVIPKEFQDWLVAAYNWKHNWTTIIDISWNWNHWTANGGVTLSRKNNTWMMTFDWSDDYVTSIDYDISQPRTILQFVNYKWTWDSWTNYVSFWTNYWNYDMIEVRDWVFKYQYNPNSWGASYIDSWITINAWKVYMFWFSYNWSVWTLYFNTYSVGSATINFWTENKTYAIWAAYSTDTNQFWLWDIWITLFYNKVLSQKQIQKMYEYFRQWYND